MLSDEQGAPSPLAGLRVLVVDDHELVARSLVLALRIEGINAHSVTGPTAEEILAVAASFGPEVVILDLELGPAGDGCKLLPRLLELDAAVVVLSGTGNRLHLAESLEAGALGVVGKTAPLHRILEAIGAAASRRPAMDPNERHAYLSELRRWREERRGALAPFSALTRREVDVLAGVCDGMSAAEIAEAQFVSVFTIRGHIRSILAKLGVGSQIAAAAMAHQVGWSPETI